MSQCPNYQDTTKRCAIASALAECPAHTTPAACARCAEQPVTRAANAVTASLAIAAVSRANQTEKVTALLNQYATMLGIGERLAAIVAGHGPGSQLWRLLNSLGIEHTVDCACLAFAEQMNAWGVDGCRARRTEIVSHLRSNASRYSWSALPTIVAKAVISGAAFTWLSPLDPYGSLVDQAIRRSVAARESPAQPIDILLPIGPGSKFGDIELRMALRSIERHALGLRRVVILGAIPGFLRETDRLQLVRRKEFQTNKASRIAMKVHWAFEHLDLSDQIAFWNDDYLLTRDVDIRTIPPIYRGELARRPKGGWPRLLNHTATVLTAAGLPALHFDIHVPILFAKQSFLKLADWWARSRADRLGYVMKSVYGNVHCQTTGVAGKDCKLKANWGARIDTIPVTRRWIFSYGDAALQAGFGAWMQDRFPTPCAGETPAKPTRKRRKKKSAPSAHRVTDG